MTGTTSRCAAIAVMLLAGCAVGSPITPDAGGDPPGRDAGSADAAAPIDAQASIDADVPDPDAGGPCASVDCTALDGPCMTGVCDPSDGSCDAVPIGDGTACDDGDLCTAGDTCSAGVCVPGAAVDCTALDDQCNAGACDPTDGSCVATPVSDGTGCDDGDACTTGDACSGGVCGGTAVDCTALDDQCNAGTCDPSDGSCFAMPILEGFGCDDGNDCTTGDVCTAGACTGAVAPSCGVLIPGRTDVTAGRDGWSVRCLSWSGRTCTRLQGRMECSVCATYASCGVWHDITTFNDSDNRSSVNWCALATGNATINSKGGSGTAVAPRGCGWGSTTHPHCEAARATFHVPVAGVPTDHGALLNETYCSASTTLLNLDCAGW